MTRFNQRMHSVDVRLMSLLARNWANDVRQIRCSRSASGAFDPVVLECTVESVARCVHVLVQGLTNSLLMTLAFLSILVGTWWKCGSWESPVGYLQLSMKNLRFRIIFLEWGFCAKFGGRVVNLQIECVTWFEPRWWLNYRWSDVEPGLLQTHSTPISSQRDVEL